MCLAKTAIYCSYRQFCQKQQFAVFSIRCLIQLFCSTVHLSWNSTFNRLIFKMSALQQKCFFSSNAAVSPDQGKSWRVPGGPPGRAPWPVPTRLWRTSRWTDSWGRSSRTWGPVDCRKEPYCVFHELCLHIDGGWLILEWCHTITIIR